MKHANRWFLLFVLTAACLLYRCAVWERAAAPAAQAYANPIDAYFLPRIEQASCEAERREWQDHYREVWKTEFENVLSWMDQKCEYPEDREQLQLFAKSVETLIGTTRAVLVTDWLDHYGQPPGSGRGSWGNGTRSGLNQTEAELYRDASMKLIDDRYVFMERSYAPEGDG